MSGSGAGLIARGRGSLTWHFLSDGLQAIYESEEKGAVVQRVWGSALSLSLYFVHLSCSLTVVLGRCTLSSASRADILLCQSSLTRS